MYEGIYTVQNRVSSAPLGYREGAAADWRQPPFGESDQQPPQQQENRRTIRMIQIQLLLSKMLQRQLFIVNLLDMKWRRVLCPPPTTIIRRSGANVQTFLRKMSCAVARNAVCREKKRGSSNFFLKIYCFFEKLVV